jgi:hypothetical protein
MKKNDLIALIFALVLLVGVGYYYISQNSRPSGSTTTTAVQVEVAPVIPPTLDPNQVLSNLANTYKVQDFKQTPNLTGLGNNAPFSNN